MRTIRRRQAGDAQLIGLIVVAVLLAAGYVALDFYGEGEKYMTMTEARGLQVIQGLTKHKLASNAYPDSITTLAPKFIPALPTCPAGEPFSYARSGADFTLGCDKVIFKLKPYRYDSRSKAWSD